MSWAIKNSNVCSGRSTGPLVGDATRSALRRAQMLDAYDQARVAQAAGGAGADPADIAQRSWAISVRCRSFGPPALTP